MNALREHLRNVLAKEIQSIRRRQTGGAQLGEALHRRRLHSRRQTAHERGGAEIGEALHRRRRQTKKHHSRRGSALIGLPYHNEHVIGSAFVGEAFA